MNSPTVRFFFDYVDPVSYLMELELQAEENASGLLVERVPFELRAPPEPMTDPESPSWMQRLEEAAEFALHMGVGLSQQLFVPWTRKAHELVVHAGAHSMGQAAHQAIFEGVFAEGLDIGRVDVLVGLGVSLGLDPRETKAVLDVDRYSDDVIGHREAALAAGIAQVPSLVAGDKRLEGFHNRRALSTFLHAAGTPDNTTD